MPVPDPLAVHLLTAFAVVVVLLTRRVLGRRSTSARQGPRHGHGVSPWLLDVHTGAGLAGGLLWVVFLLVDQDGATWHSLLGVVGLGLWWITGWAGLLLLGRWLPSRGRHSDARDRGWFVGLGLALLGHLGVAASAVVFTLAYLSGSV
ncbi:hypothetical protein INN71_15505 [Nocardioides sp. ChNu-153]|uniref:hypothetical protein n=1 Tax=Nocardioides sp. ChNu-153 TaxID=2779364 RepID=UPI002653F7A0|nr:hypothetical protein [Nocardioides sp. ChNu-153]MDN7122796.1 hypothetical protein [Nocardioides sp. ChNu-153]